MYNVATITIKCIFVLFGGPVSKNVNMNIQQCSIWMKHKGALMSRNTDERKQVCYAFKKRTYELSPSLIELKNKHYSPRTSNYYGPNRGMKMI